MSETVSFDRDKLDSFAELKPNLLLIAEKPLENDKDVVFDSEEGQNYLNLCSRSKFKTVLTHVTYVNDSKELNFVRDILFSILTKYKENNCLDLYNLVFAFVGDKAFNAFKNDYYSVFLDQKNRITLDSVAKVFKVSMDDVNKYYTFNIPYVILPDVDENKNNIINLLETVSRNKKSIENPYSTTAVAIKKLEFILDMHEKGVLKSFCIEGKINKETRKFEYCKLYDKQSNQAIFYNNKDEICKNDSIDVIKLFQTTLVKAVTTIPVYGENIKEVIDAFGKYKDQIRIATEEEIKSEDVLEKDFRVYGSANGEPSAWYDKWHKEAFLPKLKNELREKDKARRRNTIKQDGYLDEHKYEWIYDIEVFKEDWLFVAKTIDGENKVICWNDPEHLKLWISNKILIGFNNAAYDNNVIKYAMAYPQLVENYMSSKDKNTKEPLTVKQYSDLIINEDSGKDVSLNASVPNFLSWDISFHLPFDVRRNSLKKLTMSVLNKKNYDSSVPFDIDRKLTKYEREEVEKYCEMDVDNTLELFLPDPEDVKAKELDPKHEMRTFARESYDIRWNMIVEYFMTPRTLSNKSASFAGKVLCGEDAKADLQNKTKIVNGRKVFYSIPELAEKELAGTELLEFYHKHQENPNYITEKFECYLGPHDDSHLYQFGFGGLHQALINFGSTNLVNMDVASLYPSLLVQYGLMSRGAKANPGSYEEVYHKRLEAKKLSKTTHELKYQLLNEGLKLILNSAIGAMLSDYNPLYDTWSNSTICVHGQLLIFILAKRLFDAGFNIVQTNTDGIMIEKQDDVDFMPIAEQWMKDTRLVLEFDDIKILQQNNVNNYYCEFTNGKIKSKGFYLSNEKFGKATSKILCNLVTERAPLEGTEPRDFVIFKRHGIGEIYDGKTREKLEGRSLAFVVGYPNDPRTQSYYSRSRNEREVVKKDEKGKPILNQYGEQVMEKINSESKISGFTDYMLLVDDLNTLKLEEINTREYINFAKNLLGKEEDFGPYYTEGYLKSDEPTFMQALNPFKNNTDPYPTKAGMINRNFLFECDYLTKEEQEEMIKRVEEYTYRIVWSGHRSYHIVVRIDAPIPSTKYRKVWEFLRSKLRFTGADEMCNQPSRYTRVPDQINPKTGEMQTLYSERKYVFNTEKILEDLPVLHEKQITPTKFKGEPTIEALQKHIAKQDWSEGNRFAACQKLSPCLISLVSLETLYEMIPCKLDKDHKYVIRSKRRAWEKEKAEEESCPDVYEIIDGKVV